MRKSLMEANRAFSWFAPREAVAKQGHAAAFEAFEFVMTKLPSDLRKLAE
jgi:hypothetical protein